MASPIDLHPRPHLDRGCLFDPLEPRRHLAAVGPVFDTIPIVTSLGTSATTAHYAIADFDGDGIPDAAISIGHEIRFLKGHGDGTFAVPVVATLTSRVGSIAAGNFRLGGGPELVALSSVGRGIRPDSQTVLSLGYYLRILEYSAATSGFVVTARLLVPSQHYPVVDEPPVFTGNLLGAVGGKDEFIFGGWSETPVLPITYAGEYEFIGIYGVVHSPSRMGGDRIVLKSTVLHQFGVQPQFTLADINGDGRLDVLFKPASRWRAQINPGNGSPLTRITLSASPRHQYNLEERFQDLDGDHKVDRIAVYATQNYSTGEFDARVSIAKGLGNGQFGAPVQVADAPMFTVSSSGPGSDINYGGFQFDMAGSAGNLGGGWDLNHDGRADILIGGFYHTYNRSGGSVGGAGVIALLQNPDGSFTPTPSQGFGFAETLVDVNGDGRPDLVSLVSDSTLSLTVRLNIA